MAEILTREQIWQKKRQLFIARSGGADNSMTSFSAPQNAAPNTHAGPRTDTQRNTGYNTGNVPPQQWNAPTAVPTNPNSHGNHNSRSYPQGHTVNDHRSNNHGQRHHSGPPSYVANQPRHPPHNQSSIVFGSDAPPNWDSEPANTGYPKREGMLQPPVTHYGARAPSPYQSYESQTNPHSTAHSARTSGPPSSHSRGYSNSLLSHAGTDDSSRFPSDRRSQQENSSLPPISNPQQQQYQPQHGRQYAHPETQPSRSSYPGQYPPPSNDYRSHSDRPSHWDSGRADPNAPQGAYSQQYQGHPGGYSDHNNPNQRSQYAPQTGAQNMPPRPYSHHNQNQYQRGGGYSNPTQPHSHLQSDAANLFGTGQSHAPQRTLPPNSQLYSSQTNPLAHHDAPPPSTHTSTPTRNRGTVHARTSLW